MIKACEANKQTTERLIEIQNEEISEIEEEIEHAISSGEYYIIGHERLKENTKTVLKSLGYVFRIGSNENDWTISWR